MTRINERDHETLLRLQEAVCRLQDGVHDLLYPEGDANALRRSLEFAWTGAEHGITYGLEAAESMLESVSHQLQAIATAGGDFTLLAPKSVFERAKARRAARSLPPEHPDPEPGPDPEPEPKPKSLEDEMGVYHARKADWIAKGHEGKFVVIHGIGVFGIFPSYEAALEAGYRDVGLVPFLVRQINAVEPVVGLYADGEPGPDDDVPRTVPTLEAANS